MAGLTTHVLDTSQGKPANNLKIELFKVEKSEKIYINSFITNDDGRVDSPLIKEGELKISTYEILFYAGEYLKNQKPELKSSLFLDVIPIRFNITNDKDHYHVPLLLSPYSYSTYRGS